MTATATGNPPRGQAAPAGGVPARRRRRRIGPPRASTTPGKLRLIQAGLVALCLAWRAVAAFTVSQRYQHDIAVAAADLRAVTAASGTSSIGASLSTLSSALPVYTGYVEDGEIYNSLGYPVGGSFVEVASEEMHLALLPAARSAATSWFAVNRRAQALDAVYNYGAETRLEIGSGPGTAGTLFSQLETDLGAAINIDQGVFAASAAAGADAFTGLEAGLIVLALVMAAGCAWGLSRRLAEYR